MQSRKAIVRGAGACSGVSLVEVLVALIVLSVGMLGIAALYVESLRSGRSALTRSQAVVLAADMAERIRANGLGGASYTKTADAAGTLNAACAQGGTGCTPAQMAAHDIAVWHRMLDARVGAPTSLPGGRGTIAVVVLDPNPQNPLWRYTITVSWDESGQRDGDGASAPNSYVLTVEA